MYVSTQMNPGCNCRSSRLILICANIRYPKNAGAGDVDTSNVSDEELEKSIDSLKRELRDLADAGNSTAAFSSSGSPIPNVNDPKNDPDQSWRNAVISSTMNNPGTKNTRIDKDIQAELDDTSPIDELLVSGYPVSMVLTTIQTHIGFAENKGLAGAKFLRELDPLIFGMMKQPQNFAGKFMDDCPSGAMSKGMSWQIHVMKPPKWGDE
jgi:hypothetical protein